MVSQEDVVSLEEVATTSYPSPKPKRRRDETVTIEPATPTSHTSPAPKT